MPNIAAKDIAYYMKLDYTIELRRDGEGDWIASLKELEGCIAHGTTEAEALEQLQDVKSLCFEVLLAAGNEIPLPAPDEVLPSGKWLQRTPRSLHLKLVEFAKREGVSLNQMVTCLLAEAVGAKSKMQPIKISTIVAAGALENQRNAYGVQTSAGYSVSTVWSQIAQRTQSSVEDVNTQHIEMFFRTANPVSKVDRRKEVASRAEEKNNPYSTVTTIH